MCVGDIGFFPDIRFEIVKFEGTVDAGANGFPISHANRLLEAGFVDFPVEKLVPIGLSFAVKSREQ